jgi:hypothetical protein
MYLPHTTKVSGVNCAVLVVECNIISMLLRNAPSTVLFAHVESQFMNS